MTLGAREEGEREWEVTADCDSAGRRRGGRQWSKRDREGNEVVIRHMQRGNGGFRGGAAMWVGGEDCKERSKEWISGRKAAE